MTEDGGAAGDLAFNYPGVHWSRVTTIRLLLALLFILVTLLACGCTQPGTGSAPTPTASMPGVTNTTGITTGIESLTGDERHWLAYMREEEKLARDVYTVLYTRWEEPVFRNIAPAEQQHMDAVGKMIDRYGLPDPTNGKGPGEFSDPELQTLYDKLIRNGSISRTAALEVGRLVEETDIADLDCAIAASRHDDITAVYLNLRQGSLNHLAAFNNRLSRM